MREKVLLVRCPVTTIRLNQVEAPLYKLGSEFFLKSSDLGKVLGFAQPASAISHLRRYHRAEIEPHVCKAWLGVQRGSQNIARLISLQGCAILAAKVTKPEAITAKAAFAALQLQLANSNTLKSKEDLHMPQEDCKTKNQPDAETACQGTASQTAGMETVTPEILPVQVEQEADTAAKDLPVIEGPAKVVEFHGQEVPVYEVRGDLYLTGEDIGTMLGLSDPRDSVNNIFNRHRPELEMHSTTIKLMARDGKSRNVRLYSQEGCYLISMFARTETAKEVRQWLAALPRKVYQLRAVTPELTQRIKLEAFKEAAQRLAALLATPFGARLGLPKMERLVRLRASGLITQKEAAKMYDLSIEAVRKIERQLGEILGLQIKPLNQFAREKATQLVCDRILAALDTPVKGKLIVLRSKKDQEPLD